MNASHSPEPRHSARSERISRERRKGGAKRQILGQIPGAFDFGGPLRSALRQLNRNIETDSAYLAKRDQRLRPRPSLLNFAKSKQSFEARDYGIDRERRLQEWKLSLVFPQEAACFFLSTRFDCFRIFLETVKGPPELCMAGGKSSAEDCRNLAGPRS